MVMRWKPGSRLDSIAPFEDIYSELETLFKRDGCLDKYAIVEAARSSKKKLHKFFEWDDAVAGVAYRVTQAAHLIRSVEIVHIDGPVKTVRAYEPVWQKNKDRNSYEKIEDIMADPDKRAALLQRALGELLAFQRKYRNLQELAIVVRSIDEVLITIKP